MGLHLLLLRNKDRESCCLTDTIHKINLFLSDFRKMNKIHWTSIMQLHLIHMIVANGEKKCFCCLIMFQYEIQKHKRIEMHYNVFVSI